MACLPTLGICLTYIAVIIVDGDELTFLTKRKAFMSRIPGAERSLEPEKNRLMEKSIRVMGAAS